MNYLFRFITVAALLLGLCVPAQARTALTADTSFMVSSTGSNSNDCLTSPCLTIQHVLDMLTAEYDLAGHVATISVGPGSFAGATLSGKMVGQKSHDSLLLVGDNGTPANVVINGTVALNSGAQMTASGFRVNGGGGADFSTEDGGTVLFLASMHFGPATGAQIIAAPYSRIKLAISGYRIVGATSGYTAASFITAAAGQVQMYGPWTTVVIDNSPAYSSAFVLATEIGLIDIDCGIGWINGSTVTGPKWGSVLNSVAYSSSGCLSGSGFPGTVPTNPTQGGGQGG